MSGTSAGARKAVITNRKLYGKDFYKRISKLTKGVPKSGSGFGAKKVGADGLTGAQRIEKYSAIGGSRSRRGRAKIKVEA